MRRADNDPLTLSIVLDPFAKRAQYRRQLDECLVQVRWVATRSDAHLREAIGPVNRHTFPVVSNTRRYARHERFDWCEDMAAHQADRDVRTNDPSVDDDGRNRRRKWEYHGTGAIYRIG